MIDPDRRDAFLLLLEKPYGKGGLLGEPYDPEDGCLKFVMRALRLIGIETGTDLREEGHHWQDILKLGLLPQFGDVAVFQDLPFSQYHVALMLNETRAIQSSLMTNGVGRIDITRQEWSYALREIRRHESMIEERVSSCS